MHDLGLGLVDYPQIIAKPMDLSLVSLKLQQDEYSFMEEILDDIQLIWDNCKNYNQAGSVCLLAHSGSTLSQIRWISTIRNSSKITSIMCPYPSPVSREI